jgi:hypothetical protein
MRSGKSTTPSRVRSARPERIRLSLFDDRTGATPLPLPPRRLWPVGLITGAGFAVMGSIALAQLASLRGQEVKTVFDLTALLFQGFWILGWSVGVFFFGGLTLLLLLYGESARVQGGQLVHVPRLGPLRILCEYDLAKIRNLRLEKASPGDSVVQIRFDYGEGAQDLGEAMPRPTAERIVSAIQNAIAAGSSPAAEPRRELPGFDLLRWLPTERKRAPEARAAGAARDATSVPPPAATPWWGSPAALALVGANLMPIAGVVLFGWDLGEIMVLFWFESAVVGFYNLVKLAIVGKWVALFAGPFFAGHFGGFMAAHFMFVYYLFVKRAAGGPEAPVLEALSGLFYPLRFAILALFFSHGVSLVVNFLGRKEYAGMQVRQLMGAPYHRIVIMHLTIIFGGWLVMLFKSAAPALVLLVALKTAVDLRAHRREHARGAETA